MSLRELNKGHLSHVGRGIPGEMAEATERMYRSMATLQMMHSAGMIYSAQFPGFGSVDVTLSSPRVNERDSLGLNFGRE